MVQQGFFSYQGFDDSNVSICVWDVGFVWKNIGENIVYNYLDVVVVVAGWQESFFYCRNMMLVDFRQMGVVVYGGYWVQVLGQE